MVNNNLANRENRTTLELCGGNPVVRYKQKRKNKMEIQWKDIPGYEGIYQISIIGEVKNIKTNHMMNIYSRGKDKRPTVQLSKNKIRKRYLVHRLVAITFIPNPENKPEVDHIDRNIFNNSVENLRWVTKSENCQNRDNKKLSHNFDGKRKNTSLKGTNIKNNTSYIFNSISEAVRFLGYKDEKEFHCISVNVSACLSGKQKTTRGYIWEKI